MNLEKLARETIGNGGTGLAFSELAADKNSGKITGILQDPTGKGRTAHVRIEGNFVHLQSWDEGDDDGKPEAPHVAEAKAAEAAAAEEASKGKKEKK